MRVFHVYDEYNFAVSSTTSTKEWNRPRRAWARDARRRRYTQQRNEEWTKTEFMKFSYKYTTEIHAQTHKVTTTKFNLPISCRMHCCQLFYILHVIRCLLATSHSTDDDRTTNVEQIFLSKRRNHRCQSVAESGSVVGEQKWANEIWLGIEFDLVSIRYNHLSSVSQQPTHKVQTFNSFRSNDELSRIARPARYIYHVIVCCCFVSTWFDLIIFVFSRFEFV